MVLWPPGRGSGPSERGTSTKVQCRSLRRCPKMSGVTARPSFSVAWRDRSLVPGVRADDVSRVVATPGPERLGSTNSSQATLLRSMFRWLRRGVWPLVWATTMVVAAGAAYTVRDVLFVHVAASTDRSIWESHPDASPPPVHRHGAVTDRDGPQPPASGTIPVFIDGRSDDLSIHRQHVPRMLHAGVRTDH